MNNTLNNTTHTHHHAYHTQRRAFTLVMRPDEDTETEINFSNLWGFSNGPGGVAPFIRMVPLHSLCSGIRA